MIFVKTNLLPSGYLRADQIAQKLGSPVYLNSLPDTLATDDCLLFVKDANPELVKQAHDKNCRIIYDPIDTYSYPERLYWKEWLKYVDTVIAYNSFQADIFKQWFKNIAIIPHQWDARLEGQTCTQDVFKPAYIGHTFNAPGVVLKSGIDIVGDPDGMLEAMPKYNCHVTIRDALQAKMKPATKVVSSAAVGAVVITTPDESAKELLPINYPYWCWEFANFERVLNCAHDDFGGSTWNTAREMMAEVREKTSVDAIADLYMKL